MFYTAYFKQGAPARQPADHLPVQRRPRLLDRVAAHGRVRPGARRHRRRAPHAAAPYSDRRQRPEPARRHRPRVHRRARHRLFSRIAGKDKEKAFYGVDQDIDAFTKFITQFLTKYGRWNSPKYVFGESYGTMRGAGLTLALQNADVDLNGVILLSDILNWDFMPDDPQVNPGIDMPYIVALPTYAATAWYFNKVAEPAGRPAALPRPRSSASRPAIMRRRCSRATTCPTPSGSAIAQRLSAYTGPVGPLSAEDQPPHRIWRVPEGAAGRAGR